MKVSAIVGKSPKKPVMAVCMYYEKNIIQFLRPKKKFSHVRYAPLETMFFPL